MVATVSQQLASAEARALRWSVNAFKFNQNSAVISKALVVVVIRSNDELRTAIAIFIEYPNSRAHLMGGGLSWS
jgi:hypothetical protein